MKRGERPDNRHRRRQPHGCQGEPGWDRSLGLGSGPILVNARKAWRLIRSGSRNIAFDDLVKVAKAFGFVHDRTAGSHHIFNHPGLPGMLNLQPDGSKAKSYQVRQFVKLVEKYRLSLRAGPTAEDE